MGEVEVRQMVMPYYFWEYLKNMEGFLEPDIHKYRSRLDEIKRRIDAGELEDPDDPEMYLSDWVADIEYDLYQIENLANLLRKTFFTSLYSHLEARVVARCKSYNKEWIKALAKEYRQGSKLKEALSYLVIVQGVGLEIDTDEAWQEIEKYNILRNCIVHDEGILNEQTHNLDILRDYIYDKSTLSLENDTILFAKGFCEEALETIEGFLHQVYTAVAEARRRALQQIS
jgi:hypothetical protein